MDTRTAVSDSQEILRFYQDRMDEWLQGVPGSMWKEMGREFVRAWGDISAQMINDPQAWTERFARYQKSQMDLWLGMFAVEREDSEPPVRAKPGDRRFSGKAWNENPLFDYIRQSYLLASEALYECADATTLNKANKEKLKFYTRQFVDAVAPSNFFATNPEVIQQALDSKGKSLVDGMSNLMGDLDKGRISMTDESAFRLGENIATSEGAVVFENDLFQLIHYKPLTDKVGNRPLLIVPPFINKFYILDLQPENSFVRYCLEQGNNVFIVSWANPDADKSELGWDDYIESGTLKAFEVVKKIARAKTLNVVAWCVGGTLLATTLAVLAARNDDTVASATFFTTLLDFSEPGELGVFIDPEQVAEREQQVEKAGMLSGKDLALIFSMLRANDLIWSYVVNNYLKGRQPLQFDILYWNSDPTNLPANMYIAYIQNMYMENRLIEANALSFCGESINLRSVRTPCYFLSTLEDHIAPWKATFKTRDLFAGPVEFVLGASGHIAGVINPAGKNKRNYWINGEPGADAERWLETAENVPGSWWPNWDRWLKAQDWHEKAAPKTLGNVQFKPIEAAPGLYVKKRVD
ncbi:MAG: class I poly(R)-hydroxyalkanoic acid synthase [Gammaproteobacteria bacterium]|nr:class I poly(R)-hydroxyalkanoic acid synthase [Gammaproteobacteria bacterium]